MDRGQNLGQVLAHVPDLAMVLQLAGRHLEAQVEQLLTGVLELLLQVGHRQPLEIFHLHFLPPPLAGLAGAAAAALGAAPGAAFGAAPGAALIDGAAPGAAFGPFAAAPAATAGTPAMAPGIPPSATSPGFSSAGPSICRFVIQAASEACRPNSPNARSLPWVATPVRRPRWSLRYLTRAGSNITVPYSSFFFAARGARGVFGTAGFSVVVARARVARLGAGVSPPPSAAVVALVVRVARFGLAAGASAVATGAGAAAASTATGARAPAARPRTASGDRTAATRVPASAGSPAAAPGLGGAPGR